jgi:hypothetical protein
MGATGYGLSWFGVAVQWNGLAYSEALFDLAQVDDSFPWQRVAENILRSGMYQQASEGDRLAQWPDAMNFIVGRPGAYGQTPPCFQPATLLRQSFRLLGYKTSPVVVRVEMAGGPAALRGMADFSDVAAGQGGLRFTATLPQGQPGEVEVVGVRRPTAVTVDGQPAPESADPWAQDGVSWRWHEQVAMLELRLPGAGAHQVEVATEAAGPMSYGPPIRRQISFRFAQGTDGWAADSGLSTLEISGGRLRTTASGTDPYMSRDAIYVEGQAGDVLVLRISATAGATGSVFWGTEAEPGFAPQRELNFGYPPDGQVHEVRVPVGGADQWVGSRIVGLRLDPGGGVPGAVYEVESMELERAPGDGPR